MTDLVYSVFWLGVLTLGVTGVVLAHGAGLATTYARDVLHIGAGVWVLGWPLWSSAIAPVTLVGCALVATALVPILAPRWSVAARFHGTVTSADERFSGLILYAAAFAVLTTVALVTGRWFPAAAAVLALSLGDGVGGAVGRRYGRRRYRFPGGKQKTLEGSCAVWIAASVGVALAAHVDHTAVSVFTVLGLGAVAGLAEALAPRGTDNVVVPAAVWLAATWLVHDALLYAH